MIWGFHVGVLVLMAIGFVYPLSFIAFAAFFRTEKMLDWRIFQKLRAQLVPEATQTTPA